MIATKADMFDFNDPKFKAVKQIIDIIGNGTQPLSLKTSCQDFGMSIKTVEMYFDELIGLSPKEYAGVKRFRTAMDAIRSCDSKEKLFEIALACGYTNPPHMVIDFKNRGALLPNMMKYLDSLTPDNFNIFHFSKSMLAAQRTEDNK